MKILQVCYRVPFPANDGGTIAMFNHTRAFQQNGHKVHILAINTNKHRVTISSLPKEFYEIATIDAVAIDTNIKPIDAFFNLFSKKSYNIERFVSKAFDKKLAEILQKETFDIVQLESIFVAPYISTIRKYSKAKIVLRSHNVEFKIWEHLSNTCSSFLKKSYLKLLTRRLKRYELALLNSYDAIAAITAADGETFKSLGCTRPITIAPIGVNCEEYKITDPVREFPGLFHLGAMDWMPNVEGIEWFLQLVWEDLQAEHPDLKFYIAGRKMPAWLKKGNNPNVVVEGEVADAKKFMASKTIMLVPLLSGGGMRVKIVEGMALGKTIISTSLGAEGIPYTHNKDILIADSPLEFKSMITKCIQDKSFCENIGNNAKNLATTYFDNTLIGQNLIQFYRGLVNGQ